MTRKSRTRARGAALLVHLACAMACALAAAPAAAMQILEAADHGELRAEVSARAVSRVALIGDRIARVVRAPRRLRGRARPRAGRSLSAAPGRRGRRAAGDAVRRHREGLHLPAHARGRGPRLGADPDPQRRRRGDHRGRRGRRGGRGRSPHRGADRAGARGGAARAAAGLFDRGGARGRRARTVHRGRDLARPALRGAGAGARPGHACRRRAGRCGEPRRAARPRVSAPGSRRSGWRRPAPGPAAGGSRSRSRSRCAPARETCDERGGPCRPGRRVPARAQPPARAVLGRRGGAAGGVRALAHGVGRQGAGAHGAHRGRAGRAGHGRGELDPALRGAARRHRDADARDGGRGPPAQGRERPPSGRAQEERGERARRHRPPDRLHRRAAPRQRGRDAPAAALPPANPDPGIRSPAAARTGRPRAPAPPPPRARPRR